MQFSDIIINHCNETVSNRRMKEMKRDILADNPQLRKQTYTVPEGYFEDFKSQMKPYQEKQGNHMAKISPYISIAASFIFIVTAGTFLLQRTVSSDELTQEDYLLFANSMVNIEYYEDTDQIAEASMEEEEIIEYLIYSGISAEEIELSK